MMNKSELVAKKAKLNKEIREIENHEYNLRVIPKMLKGASSGFYDIYIMMNDKQSSYNQTHLDIDKMSKQFQVEFKKMLEDEMLRSKIELNLEGGEL